MDVPELFQGIQETVSVMKKEHSVDVVTEYDSEKLHTDEDLIRDVIINLVDNAIKASVPGKCVCVAWKEGVLSVHDEGIGIPKGRRIRAWTISYEADPGEAGCFDGDQQCARRGDRGENPGA